MNSDKVVTIRREELSNWRKELKDKIINLENELEELETTVEKLRIRYSLSERVYQHTRTEVFDRDFKKPYYESFKNAQKEFEQKYMENESLISTYNQMISYIDMELKTN